MPWGIRHYGSLDGAFVGHDEDLEHHFNEVMSEAERAEYEYFQDYRYKVSRKIKEDFGPCLPHEVPTIFHAHKTYDVLRDMISLGGYTAVSEDLKNVIESLATEHQFFPVALMMPRGKVYPTQYYILVPQRYLDSFSPSKSAHGAFTESGSSIYWSRSNTKKWITQLALSRAIYGDAALWCETKFRSLDLFFSDALMEAVHAKGLMLPKVYELNVAEDVLTSAVPETSAPHGSTEWFEFMRTTKLPTPAPKPAGSVWAICNFSGVFLSQGTFPKWDEALIAHYETMSDSDKHALGLADRFDISVFADRVTEGAAPITPVEEPPHFHVNFKVNCLPDLSCMNAVLPKHGNFSFPYARPLAVSEKLKALLEQLEPNVHAFWPIRVTSSYDDIELDGPYFGLRIGHHLKAFVPKASDTKAFQTSSKGFSATSNKPRTLKKLAISSKAVSGCHLWCDTRLGYPRLFMSADLVSRCDAGNLILPQHFQLKTV